MTSAEKRVFVIVSVLISFFAYLASAALTGKVLHGSFVSGAAAFVTAACMLDVMMKRFPEEAENEMAQAMHITKCPTGKGRLACRVLLCTALMLCVNFLLSLVAGDTSMPDKKDLLLRAAMGALLIPAMEEYLFRHGYLKALLKADLPPYVAVTLQAVLFAFLHRGVGIPIAFVCAIVLGTLYLKSEGKYAFWAVCAAHGLYNGTLYLILALS